MKNLKTRVKTLILIILSLGAISSCVVQYTKNEESLAKIQEDEYGGFDLETVRLESLSFTLNTASEQPLEGVLFKLWTKSPVDDGKVILKGITDENGQFSLDYNLSTTLESVVLETGYIGLANYLVISRDELLKGVVINGMNHSYSYLPDNLIPNSSIDTGNINDDRNNGSGRTEETVYNALGSYDSQGVPNYLEPVADVITPEMLSFINVSLPEGKPVPTYHPAYIAENAQTNLIITETADVWMTFVHEGAGYRNILGFYTYPTGNPPTSVSEITKVDVVFPNASFEGSGGGLNAGDKVNIGRFEPGVTIGFVLLANGWNGSITSGIHQVYSDSHLNPESTPELRRHSVLLWDEINELFLIGFEDLNRESGSDEDFNDAIFYITANPIESISLENVNPIDQPIDADGDGVNDVYDEFPTDPSYAYVYDYPGDNTYGTFAFEDQWPRTGDYDFNDLVVDYKYSQYANATNQMVKLNAEYVIKAVGAGFNNAFGIQLDVNNSFVQSVSGNAISPDTYFSFNANGTEANQSKAVIIVSDDVHQGFGKRGFINTSSTLEYLTPDTIRTEVVFANAISLPGAGSAPFNPFLVINQERGREVHMPNSSPTDLVNTEFFGKENDDSNASGVFYRSKKGLPWGMNLPTTFDYPMEKTDVRLGYNHFNNWALSGGFNYMDWYTDKVGYRTHENLYRK